MKSKPKPQSTCTVAGCSRRVYAAGVCWEHRQEMLKKARRANRTEIGT